MKKNEVFTIRIKDIIFPACGVANHLGNTIHVKNTIPEQEVLVRIASVKKKIAKAVVLDTIKKSPVEIDPACPHFNICGSCVYQNIPYEIELEFKKKQTLSILNNSGIENFIFDGIYQNPSVETYRNKMEFSFGDLEKGGALSLGMHKRNSYYDIITISACNIMDGDFKKILLAVEHFFRERNIPFYHKTAKTGILRHLVVRKGQSGEILINLVTKTEMNGLDSFAHMLLEIDLKGTIVGILHTVNEREADVVQSDYTNILYGRDFFYEELLAIKFKVSAFSFFQTNTKGAEVLFSIVKQYAKNVKNKTVFDLYCGTGTISLILASEAKQVYGIELNEEAIASAKENARMNHVNNVQFIAGDVLKEVSSLPANPDLIVIDPPRDGIHPKAIRPIIQFNAKHIIYISCKPSSMAKDLKALEGYRVERISCVDLFSRTPHVETVVLLQRKICL